MQMHSLFRQPIRSALPERSLPAAHGLQRSHHTAEFCVLLRGRSTPLPPGAFDTILSPFHSATKAQRNGMKATLQGQARANVP